MARSSAAAYDRAMDASWWPALAAVVLLAVVAGLVDSWGRLSRAHRRRAMSRLPGRGAGPPDPLRGEVWWAEVPAEAGEETGEAGGGAGQEAGQEGGGRPFLVIRVDEGSATVAAIGTGLPERPGAVALPPGVLGDARDRPGYVETDRVRRIDVAGFRRRTGQVEPEVWDRVKHLADS